LDVICIKVRERDQVRVLRGSVHDEKQMTKNGALGDATEAVVER